MWRFLIGIFLVQIATVALVLLSPDLQGLGWFRLVVPLVVIGFFTAFWFQSIAKFKSKDELENLKGKHLREKAKIELNAERAKTKLVKQTQKQIAREAKITHAKANFKVGASFAAVVGAGALMLITELFTFGLLTLTTAGGALGGYVLRARRDGGLLRNNPLPIISEEAKPKRLKR
ncbi:MAG TPA: hypothetical protein EYG68_00355 [Leucothrix mucor]|nr:hypothetical protein [Leucothrix mucor]